MYNDAMRRKNKVAEPANVVEESKRCNTVDEAYLLKKYEREFSARVAEIGKEIFNYDDICKFLKQFGCISSLSDEELLPELWKYLEGDNRNGVSKNNLNLALKAILHLPASTAGAAGTGPEAQFSNEGDIQLGDKQCSFLHSKFLRFSVNKQCNSANDSSEGRFGEAYTFKPQINKKSEELAAAAQLKQGTVMIHILLRRDAVAGGQADTAAEEIRGVRGV